MNQRRSYLAILTPLAITVLMVNLSSCSKTTQDSGDSPAVTLQSIEPHIPGRPIGFSPDSATVLTEIRFADNLSRRGLQSWSIADGKLVGPIIEFDGSAMVSPDGKTVATYGTYASPSLWVLGEDPPRARGLRPSRHHVSGVAFSPDSKVLAVAGFESPQPSEVYNAPSIIQLYSVADGQAVGKPISRSQGCAGLSFSWDGKILTTTWNNRVFKYHASTGVEAASYDMRNSPERIESPDGSYVVNLNQHPDAQTDISRRWGSSFTVTAGGNPSSVSGKGNHGPGILSASFAPDGKVMATVNEYGEAQLWRMPTAEPIGEPIKHRYRRCHVVFSPDGTWLATVHGGTPTSALRVWSAAAGKPLCESVEDIGSSSSAIISPDGKLILTPLADGLNHTGRLWRVE